MPISGRTHNLQHLGRGRPCDALKWCRREDAMFGISTSQMVLPALHYSSGLRFIAMLVTTDGHYRLSFTPRRGPAAFNQWKIITTMKPVLLLQERGKGRETGQI